MRASRSRSIWAATIVLSATWAGAGAFPATAATGPRVVGAPQPIPVQARALGPVDPAAPLLLTVALRPRHRAALTRLVRAVSSPGSPLYRHYLTPAGFADRFGAGAAGVARVTAALRDLGLDPGRVAPNGLSIPIRAPAGVVESALHVRLTRFRLPGGAVGFADVGRPTLPDGAARTVQAVIGLDTLPAAHPVGLGIMSRPAAPPAAPATRPGVRPAAGPVPCAAAAATARTFSGYTADEIAQAYGFPQLYAAGDLGQGQQVGLVEFAGYVPSDVQAYLACFGLHTPISEVPVDGGARIGPGTSEATIDVEDLAGLAPGAHISVYEGPNGANSVIYATYSAAISADTVHVLSTSWGSCEADVRGGSFLSAENTLFQEAAVQGQTIVAASGDDGSEDCLASDKVKTLAVDDPSSQPNVTGVGGTTLDRVGSPPTESAWNDNLGAGGGGISSVWPMPSWQTGPGVLSAYSSGLPCHAATGDCREVPDVSASAAGSHPYIAYCRAGDCSSAAGWLAFFGTSLAAPVWAAVATLSDQVCAASGQPAVGFLNPSLYPLAAGPNPPFNDVTTGNNDFTGTNGGAYPATPGYDMATGLGSPRATALAADLCARIRATPTALTLIASAAAPVATGTIAISGSGAGSPYTAQVAPGAAWLSVAPATGAIPAALTVTATATGLGPGTYQGSVDIREGTGSPLVVPVSLAVALPPSAPAVYHPLAPLRVLDTRPGSGRVGAGRSLGAGQALTLPLGGVDGIPGSGAAAVVLNVTAVAPTADTAVTVFPAGGPRPVGSDLSAAAGRTVAGLVTAQLGPTGAVRLYNASGRVNLIADLEGWYGGSPSGSAGLFHPLAPARIADTRPGSAGPDAGHAPGPGGTLTVQVAGAGGVPATGAEAVALDITVAGSSAPGYVTVYPSGSPRPLASAVNFPAGRVVANRAIVALGPTGAVTIANGGGTTNLVVDVSGWFGGPTGQGPGSAYVATAGLPLAAPGAAAGQLGAALGPGGRLTVQVAGVGPVPPMTGATPPSAVALVVTASGDAAPGYLTVFPGGAVPHASDLNWPPGATVANLVLAALSPTGTVTLYNATGHVTATVVAVGWYTPAA